MYRDAYLETEILSATPVRLVELLYRGGLDAVRLARNALDASNIAERSRQIVRGQAILAELSLTLDHQRGGALSRELAELYDYMQRRLNNANSEQRAEPLDEVSRLLETLLEAWSSVSGSIALDPVAANQSAGQPGGVNLEGTRVYSLC